MKALGVALLGLLASCGRRPPLSLGELAAPSGASSSDAGVLAPFSPGCADAGTPPPTLACTGLYADLAAKQLAQGVRPYTPAVSLWSDGAGKERWIYLPPGTVIDNSNPSEWAFPVGTKLWKEFSLDGRRVETRLWQKVRDRFWVDATYAWNDDESGADRSAGGDIPFGAGTYHIPTQDECEKCHRGRTENILGFEQVELGLSGAAGFTLAELVAEGRLSVPPTRTSLSIGDDGTGAAASALGWLHANCGITCHNRNSGSTAYAAGMFLRLDPLLLDGRPLADSDPLQTTVGITVNNPNWNGRTRIVPGDPGGSLLYHLISSRGVGDQMPPIATSLVDQPNVALIEDWIRRMTITPGKDAGP
jgi:hypothetical protein